MTLFVNQSTPAKPVKQKGHSAKQEQQNEEFSASLAREIWQHKEEGWAAAILTWLPPTVLEMPPWALSNSVLRKCVATSKQMKTLQRSNK